MSQDNGGISDCIKAEKPIQVVVGEAACIGCLNTKGDFTLLNECVHTEFLRSVTENRESSQIYLICSTCHSFARKVYNFQKRVEENVAIFASEFQVVNKLEDKDKLISRNLPSIDIYGDITSKNIASKERSVKKVPSKETSMSTNQQQDMLCSKKSTNHSPIPCKETIDSCSRPKNQNNKTHNPSEFKTPVEQKQVPTINGQSKIISRKTYNSKSTNYGLKRHSTNDSEEQATNKKRGTWDVNVAIEEYSNQVQKTGTNEVRPFELTNNFLKKLLDNKQNVGRLYEIQTNKIDDKSESTNKKEATSESTIRKGASETETEASTNHSETDEVKEESDSDTGSDDNVLTEEKT